MSALVPDHTGHHLHITASILDSKVILKLTSFLNKWSQTYASHYIVTSNYTIVRHAC